MGEGTTPELQGMDATSSNVVAESVMNCRLGESATSPNMSLVAAMGADSTPHVSLGNDEAHQAESCSFERFLLSNGILNSLSSKSEIVYTLRKQFDCSLARPSSYLVVEA